MTIQRRVRPDGAAARVVIVDDDFSVRRALARLLRTEGYRVSTFGSAEEFLSSCVPDEVDCLILDLFLEGMTGLDLCAKLAVSDSAPPTILMTAHEEATADSRLFARPAVKYLQKPIEDVSLLEAVDSAVRQRQP